MLAGPHPRSPRSRVRARSSRRRCADALAPSRSGVSRTEPHSATSARVSTTEIRRTPTQCQTPWSGGPSARLRAVRRQAKGSTRGASHLTRPQSCGRVRGHALEITVLAPCVARTASGALTGRRSTVWLGSRPRPLHREAAITHSYNPKPDDIFADFHRLHRATAASVPAGVPQIALSSSTTKPATRSAARPSRNPHCSSATRRRPSRSSDGSSR